MNIKTNLDNPALLFPLASATLRDKDGHVLARGAVHVEDALPLRGTFYPGQQDTLDELHNTAKSLETEKDRFLILKIEKCPYSYLNVHYHLNLDKCSA